MTHGKMLLCINLHCMSIFETYLYTSILSYSMMVSYVQKFFYPHKNEEILHIKAIRKMHLLGSYMETRVEDVDKPLRKDIVITYEVFCDID